MRTGGGGGEGFPKQLAAISIDPIKINEAERGLRVEGASFAPPSPALSVSVARLLPGCAPLSFPPPRRGQSTGYRRRVVVIARGG